MKKQAWVILVLTLPLAAFAIHHKKIPAANHILSVSLRHTACYGHCPIYTIEVSKEGIATYTAVLFCPDTGTFTKDIGKAKAMGIIDKFNAYRIDTCSSKYSGHRYADLPGGIFTIRYDTATKTITDANAGPRFFGELRNSLDSLVNHKLDNSWRKVSEPEK